jgi:hypothetical protein
MDGFVCKRSGAVLCSRHSLEHHFGTPPGSAKVVQAALQVSPIGSLVGIELDKHERMEKKEMAILAPKPNLCGRKELECWWVGPVVEWWRTLQPVFIYVWFASGLHTDTAQVYPCPKGGSRTTWNWNTPLEKYLPFVQKEDAGHRV